MTALAPRETVGSAIGRTAVKSLTAVIIIGGGLLIIPFLFLLVAAAIGAAAGGGIEETTTPTELIVGEADADVRLVAVPISGLILGEESAADGGGLFSPVDITYGYKLREDLAELAQDDSIDGIILEINSPGGTVFGSRAIAEGVAEYQAETGKPVVAFVSGISASGGVYAMAGADQIYADYGTLVGSIGVIFGPFTTFNDVTAIDGGLLGGGVTTEGGIDFEFLTAGRSKDFGNPYRPITDEERAVLQEGLDDAYADFVNHVSEGRDISAAEIEDGLGALIFGEQQAVANGLIDGVADRDESYRLAAVEAGMVDGETFRVERLLGGPPGFLDLFGASVDRINGVDGTTGEPIEAGAGETDGGSIQIEPLCLGTGVILAYHGDPSLLCTGGP